MIICRRYPSYTKGYLFIFGFRILGFEAILVPSLSCLRAVITVPPFNYCSWIWWCSFWKLRDPGPAAFSKLWSDCTFACADGYILIDSLGMDPPTLFYYNYAAALVLFVSDEVACYYPGFCYEKVISFLLITLRGFYLSVAFDVVRVLFE